MPVPPWGQRLPVEVPVVEGRAPRPAPQRIDPPPLLLLIWSQPSQQEGSREGAPLVPRARGHG